MAGVRYRAGAIFAVVVFVLGVTAAVAAGWSTSGDTNDKVAHEGKGKEGDGRDDNDKGRSKDNGDREGKKKDNEDKDHGDKEKSKGKEDQDTDNEDNESKDQPAVTTPSAPGAPITVQTTPSSPTTPLTPSSTPSTTPGSPALPGEPVVAKTPGEETELTPAAKRKKLAETGLDPALIAVLGMMLVGGGVLLFRRAFAR